MMRRTATPSSHQRTPGLSPVMTPSSPASPRVNDESIRDAPGSRSTALSPWAMYKQLLSPRAQHQSSPLRITTVATAVAAVIAGACFLLLLIIFHAPRHEKSGTCISPACWEFAKLMVASVNISLDPCANFDAFVCSGWRSRRKFSVHAMLAANAIDKMTEVLSKDMSPPATGQNIVQKAGLFYRSCDMVWRGERDELPVIRECFRRAGIAWPRMSLEPNVLRTLLILNIVFDWAVLIRVFPSSNNIWIAVAPSFELVVKEREKDSNLDSRRISFEFIRDQFSGGDTEAAVTFDQVSQLEEKIVPSLTAARRRLSKGTFSARNLDKDKWMNLFAEFNVTTKPSFRTYSFDYVLLFIKYWKKIGENNMHLFVSWMAARYASLFANRDLITNHYGTTNQDLIKYEHGRWCYRLVYKFVGDYLFVPYNIQGFYPEVRRDVERIALSIRKQFATRLSSKVPFSTVNIIRWNSLDIALKALNQSAARDENFHASTIFLPDMNFSLVKNWELAWGMFRLKRNNAIPRVLGWDSLDGFSPYSYWLSDYVLAPYVLSFPLYELFLVDAVKYGALGAYVAQASADISLHQYYSNDATRRLVQLALDCVGRSDGRSKLAGLINVLSLDVLVDAFKIYGSETRLADFNSLTDVQLFFVAWCYIRCRGFSEALGDDCSSAVRHVTAFSSAFSCSLDEPLNPQNKCALF